MNDEYFMRHALALAESGLTDGFCPIGSVLVLDGEVVVQHSWQPTGDTLLGHPELLCLQEAEQSMPSGRSRAVLYSTLEPCLMCTGAAMSFFLGQIVYALPSPTDGAVNLAQNWRPRSQSTSGTPFGRPAIRGGVLEDESRRLMQRYVNSAHDNPVARWAKSLV
jgi:tRNA(adenine34) deaminase